MRRLAATLWCDLQLQFRNGFYYASALVVVASVILLSLLPEAAVAWVVPSLSIESRVFQETIFWPPRLGGVASASSISMTCCRFGQVASASLRRTARTFVVTSIFASQSTRI